jgi:hypothetical protein
MIQPDKNVMRSILRLSSQPDTKPFWDDIVEWFTKSYAERIARNVCDLASPDYLARINQGRALELFDILKNLRKTKEDLTNDRPRTGGLENL